MQTLRAAASETTKGAHGVVVSHPLSMRKAHGFKSKCVHDQVAKHILPNTRSIIRMCPLRLAGENCKGGCHIYFVCDSMIFADGHAVSNAPDLCGPWKLTGTGQADSSVTSVQSDSDSDSNRHDNMTGNSCNWLGGLVV